MLLTFGIPALALVTLAASASIQGRTSNVQSPRAIYFLSTQQPSAEIYALNVLSDGRVTAGSKTPLGPGGPDIDPAAISVIFPQGAVRIVDKFLFAINAASNTVSMFEIDPSNPTKLTRIGNPVRTAQYPASVTASLKNNLVCVANAGTPTGLSCASFSPGSGIGKMDQLRPYFTSDGVPSSGTFNLVGATFFSNDENTVFTTIMGNTTTFKGFLSAYTVSNDAVSYKQVTSSPAGSAFLYGATNIPGTSEILAADPIGGGAIIIDINSKLQGITKFFTNIPGQIASCWAEISSKTGSGYITDPNNKSIYEIDVQTGVLLSKLSDIEGPIDFMPGGGFLYVVTAGNATQTPNNVIIGPAVLVADIRGGKGSIKNYQSFTPEGMTATAQGMAVFPMSSS